MSGITVAVSLLRDEISHRNKVKDNHTKVVFAEQKQTSQIYISTIVGEEHEFQTYLHQLRINEPNELPTADKEETLARYGRSLPFRPYIAIWRGKCAKIGRTRLIASREKLRFSYLQSAMTAGA